MKSAYKTTWYIISSILILCSAATVCLSLWFDSEGYIMASQTVMLGAGVISIWAMTALLAGKG